MEIRKKGTGFLMITVTSLLFFLSLFGDKWIEWAMESAGRAVIGAKVEFDGVNFSLSEARLRWDRLQVSNPYDTRFNLFETGLTDLDISLEPLILKRFIIENMRIDSLRFITLRSNSGEIAGRVTPLSTQLINKIQTRLSQELDSIPVLKLVWSGDYNADSLLQISGIQTPQKIDSLHNATSNRIDELENLAAELPDSAEIAELRIQIDTISTSGLSPGQAVSVIRNLNPIRKQIDSLRSTVDSIRNILINLQEDLSNAQINAWINQDIKRTVKFLEIPSISTTQITRILFAPIAIGRYQSVLTYIGLARYYSQKIGGFFPKREFPPRLSGQNITYSPVRDWPSFWIVRAAVSGRIVKNVSVAGLISNIVLSQDIINQPTVVQINSTSSGISLSLMGILNYIDTIPREQVTLSAGNVPLDGIRISESALLPFSIASGSGQISSSISLAGGRFEAQTSFSGTNLSFSVTEQQTGADPRIFALSQSIAKAIDNFSVRTSATMINEQFQFEISSSAGPVIAGVLNQKMKQELDRLEIKLRENISEKTAQSRENLQRQFLKVDSISKRFSEIDDSIENLISALNTKLSEIR